MELQGQDKENGWNRIFEHLQFSVQTTVPIQVPKLPPTTGNNPENHPRRD